MMTPRIGISCDFETITDSRGFPSPRYVCPSGYVDAVARAGGHPVLLPHTSARPVADWLAELDAVVVTGGDFDIPPAYYGEQERQGLRQLIPERSRVERDLCHAALERRLPLLGVCAGMQLLNVVLGGTLYQDLDERPGTSVHEQPNDKRKPGHSVSLIAGTRLAEIFAGRKSLEVNSTHHQIVNDIPDSLRIAARAPDGVVEAIESPGEVFVLGVQWHPELLSTGEHQAIYDALIHATMSGG